MGRLACHPEYKPWSEDRLAEMRRIHRLRHGAPEGFCTIYGVHVPGEHHDPLRYWAEWLAQRYGREEAVTFVEEAKSSDWQVMPRLRELWASKKAAAYNRKVIRSIEREARHANKNSR